MDDTTGLEKINVTFILNSRAHNARANLKDELQRVLPCPSL